MGGASKASQSAFRIVRHAARLSDNSFLSDRIVYRKDSDNLHQIAGQMMYNLLVILFSLLFAATPSLAAPPSSGTGRAPFKETSKDKQAKIELARSFSRIKKSLSKCWRPDKNFNGSLSFVMTLDEHGKIRRLMRYVGSQTDTAIEQTAMAAIQSCQPYVLPTSAHHWNSLRVELSKQVELLWHTVIAPNEKHLYAPSKPTLTSGEIAELRKQVAACTKTGDFESETELELHLNRDGSVAPSSKVISAATPEIGRNILDAATKCQPYSLPAEKYDLWKAMILVFVSKRT
jgi:hypothetical protein